LIVDVPVSQATLTNADFNSAVFLPSDKTTFAQANMDGANLSGAKAPGLAFTGAKLGGANLSNIDAPEANFEAIKAESADFSNANMFKGSFKGAEVKFADFSNARMAGSDMTKANLKGATLTGADLDGIQWEDTTCPDGVNSHHPWVPCGKCFVDKTIKVSNYAPCLLPLFPWPPSDPEFNPLAPFIMILEAMQPVIDIVNSIVSPIVSIICAIPFIC
jgi:hypothetical protein